MVGLAPIQLLTLMLPMVTVRAESSAEVRLPDTTQRYPRMIVGCDNYAVVRFEKATQRVLSLPKISVFLVVCAGIAGTYHEKNGDPWRSCSPENLPLEPLCILNGAERAERRPLPVAQPGRAGDAHAGV